MFKRNPAAPLHIGGAALIVALILLSISLYSRLGELEKGLDEGFDAVGTYQNIEQGTHRAIDLSIVKGEEKDAALTWHARDFSEGSGAADELGHEGAVEATADPNGFRLLSDDGELVATMHLSPGDSPEGLVLYLDLLGKAELLEFDKVADSPMVWNE